MLIFFISFVLCFQGIMTEVVVTQREYGEYFDTIRNQNTTVLEFTFKNNNMTVKMISYGATITSILVPDKNGKVGDVALGFENLSGKKEKSVISK